MKGRTQRYVQLTKLWGAQTGGSSCDEGQLESFSTSYLLGRSVGTLMDHLKGSFVSCMHE